MTAFNPPERHLRAPLRRPTLLVVVALSFLHLLWLLAGAIGTVFRACRQEAQRIDAAAEKTMPRAATQGIEIGTHPVRKDAMLSVAHTNPAPSRAVTILPAQQRALRRWHGDKGQGALIRAVQVHRHFPVIECGQRRAFAPSRGGPVNAA